MNDITKEPVWQEGSFPKNCGCGSAYTERTWPGLRYCGVLPGVRDTNGRRFYADLEIRRCRCGASLAVKLNKSSRKRGRNKQ